ncbi:MAG: zinc ribbon domain-containing protein [Gemmatimonadota bacterium]|nr:zinc ribbon domain-containing protein [Gemmatimonadota bacterium]
MPTYEFRCPSGHGFERFYRKFSDAASELPCPECGAIAARQLSAGAGLLFKGSGFYLTDYGKNAHRKTGPTGAGGKSGEGTAEGAAAGGDSKPGDVKPADSKASATSGAEKQSTSPPKSRGGGDKS